MEKRGSQLVAVYFRNWCLHPVFITEYTAITEGTVRTENLPFFSKVKSGHCIRVYFKD